MIFFTTTIMKVIYKYSDEETLQLKKFGEIFDGEMATAIPSFQFDYLISTYSIIRHGIAEESTIAHRK